MADENKANQPKWLDHRDPRDKADFAKEFKPFAAEIQAEMIAVVNDVTSRYAGKLSRAMWVGAIYSVMEGSMASKVMEIVDQKVTANLNAVVGQMLRSAKGPRM